MLEFGVMGEGSHGQMAVVALSNAAELGKKVDEHLRRVMPPTPEGTSFRLNRCGSQTAKGK